MADPLLAESTMDGTLAACLFGGISVAMIVMGVVRIVRLNRQKSRGECAMGQVVDFLTVSDSDSDSCHENCKTWAIIEYEVDGQMFRAEPKIVQGHPPYRLGETVPIYYFPERPAQGRPCRSGEYSGSLWCIFFGSIILTFVTVLVVATLSISLVEDDGPTTRQSRFDHRPVGLQEVSQRQIPGEDLGKVCLRFEHHALFQPLVVVWIKAGIGREHPHAVQLQPLLGKRFYESRNTRIGRHAIQLCFDDLRFLERTVIVHTSASSLGVGLFVA